LDTGAEGTAIAQGVATVPTQQFETHDALVEHLVGVVREGDRVLFKASHSVGLDRVVNDLKTRL
jgi:UDP-N-acetylmuramoyl-tripeptide--D-alanyl-D-alanine ligase